MIAVTMLGTLLAKTKKKKGHDRGKFSSYFLHIDHKEASFIGAKQIVQN